MKGFKEEYSNLTGKFKIELLNKDNEIIDSFEDNNLIVNTARNNLALITAGISTGSPISKFKIGTAGHTDNIQTPKTIVDGLSASLTSLFSELDPINEKTYEIAFTPTASSATSNRSIISQTDDEVGSAVSVVQLGRTVTYTITIDFDNANFDSTPETPIYYTEAGFYCESLLFNIKAFPGKPKDSSSKMTITWTLEF